MTLHLNSSVFNADNVRRIIQENQKGGQDERTGPAVAFLPDGRHVIRWFWDPAGELFREVMIGRVGRKRFICPDFLARKDKMNTYPTCELDAIAKERDVWKDKCRYHCLVYGALYETKNASEYWKVDENRKPTPYVIIGNTFLKRALVAMMENLQDNGMDMLVSMLTPNVRGFFSSVSVTRGQQGNISIQVLGKSVDPIELDDWFVPLSEVYIPHTFDEKTYREAMSEYAAGLVREGSAEKEAESILDAQEEIEVISVPSMPAIKSTSTHQILSDDNAVELTPRVKPATKRVVKKSAELPEGISVEMLPDGCPGWGNYATDLSVCALCDYNIECMAVGDSKS